MTAGEAFFVKTGLIMEGGAMRGMFTCGVTDVLVENGVRFDGAAGISAGGIFGCNVKSGQPGRVIRYNKRYCRDPRYCSLRSLIRTGDLYGADFCYRELPDELDPFDYETFRKDPMEFWVGATNVRTGLAEYHRCTNGRGDDVLWMRASASMPVVSRPVEIGGEKYLDGGIVDAVPYAFMEGLGYDRNVIILTQPKGYAKERSRFMPVMELFLAKYPAIADGMNRRHDMYNRQMREISEREGKGVSLVIRPPCALGIGRTEKDPSELERVYGIGRAEGARNLEAVRSFLAAEGNTI